jgi:hypothetical protein
MTTRLPLAVTELYSAWLAAQHKTATLRAVTEHFRHQLPPGAILGKPCRKHGHTWNDTPWCLRKDSHCLACEAARSRVRSVDPDNRRARDRDYFERNRHAINARRRERLQECPELREQKNARHRQARARIIAQGLSTRSGQPRKRPFVTEVHRSIRRAGRCPTVAQLVAAEQRKYWREHGDEYRTYCVKRRREQWRWRYMVCPDVRRRSREKARRRKALERGNHVVRVISTQIRERFQQFDHCCAYCGARGSQLHIEHFLPISKKGTHVLSNILPACLPCNYSKRALDPEAWYRAQPFFTEQRWRTILRALGKQRVPVGQLSLV